MFRLPLTTLICLAALCMPAAAQSTEQRDADSRRRFYYLDDRGAASPASPPNNEIDLRRAFSPITSDVSRSTVTVLVRGQQVALGIIVSPEGRILTKASELRGPAIVRLPDGRTLPARLVGASTEFDVAMLEVDAKNLRAVQLSDGPDPRVGRWLASVGPAPVPVAVGVVSVGRRIIPADVVMGVMLDDSDVAGARVIDVVPGGGAFRAGIQRDDLIVAIEDQQIAARQDVTARLAKMRAGQQISVRVQRGDENLNLVVTLGVREPGSTRSSRQNQMGGRLSERRTGFADALQHDMVNLSPNECGSAIVTLDGEVVGMNIARHSRTDTYALPASVLRQLIDEFEAGKHPPTTQPTAAAKPVEPTTRPAGKS